MEADKEINIKSDWKDSLMWCPSQCYLNLSFENKKYHIYLRWRWQDPWSCELVPYYAHHKDNDGDWIGLFDPNNSEEYFKDDDDLDKIKAKAIENAKAYLTGKMAAKYTY